MKRLLCLAAALGLALSLAACGAQEAADSVSVGEPEVFTICLDDASQQAFGAHLRALKTRLREEYTIEFVTVPINDSFAYYGEGEAADMMRMRTEIMSGRGPDLFILADGGRGNALLREPEKQMRAGVFLDLSPYLDRFRQGRSLNETVLAAGRAEDKQYLLPLNYLVPCLLADAEEYAGCPASPADAPADFLNAVAQHYGLAEPWAFSMATNFSNAIAWQPLLDYDAGTVTVSPDLESLLDLLCQVQGEGERLLRAGSQSKPFPSPETPVTLRQLGENAGEASLLQDLLEAGRTPALVPVPNGRGGVTASVYLFGGVRANSPHVELAVEILDSLLTQEAYLSAGSRSQTTLPAYFPLDDALTQPLAQQTMALTAQMAGEPALDTSGLVTLWTQAAEGVDSARFSAFGSKALYYELQPAVIYNGVPLRQAIAEFTDSYRFYFDE